MENWHKISFQFIFKYIDKEKKLKEMFISNKSVITTLSNTLKKL